MITNLAKDLTRMRGRGFSRSNLIYMRKFYLTTDKEGVLALANEGHQVQTAADIIRDPFVLEFAGLPRHRRYREKMLCPDRPEAVRNKTRRHRTDESLSELFQE